MTNSIHSLPPATYELRSERREYRQGLLDNAVWRLWGGIVCPLRGRAGRLREIVPQVERHGPEFARAGEEELRAESGKLRLGLLRDGFRDELVARTFALVRELAERNIGMRHFDCQLVGGLALLKGMIAEMETGEGKTLTATLAAGVAALAGIPVHVITVNDYLAARDAEWMGPVYRALGLTVGCITHAVGPEDRRTAYQSDVTYCTNKEIVFDYLRDRIALGDRTGPLRLQAEHLYGARGQPPRLLIRGLHFGIVDEADSVLIDEARTPLIISGKASAEERHFMEQALDMADGLEPGIDYQLDLDERRIELTEDGRQTIAERSEPLGPLWRGTVRREEVVRQGLTARHLFRRDEHYLVRDGRVEIVDEFTGRVMPDRSWERGLHQLIEIKEDCDMTPRRETRARISYQRFFRRYLRLAGMTGTASEAVRELWAVYGLPVVRIPTNRPLRRKKLPDRVFPTLDAKWRTVVERVRQLHEEGRPVLVGTRTVAASEHLSRLLLAEDLEHQVLNAKFDREEAEIIARAGERGRITIATNMAGRGTDIKLASGITQLQGLHVILTERHEAGRIDRQLAGRCGRQGDPGTNEAFLSLEDPLLEGERGGWPGRLARGMMRSGMVGWRWGARLAIQRAQKKLERVHARMRRELLKQDEQRGSILSFSGAAE